MKKKIIIIGDGFAGYNAALYLSRHKSIADICLIGSGFFVNKPLLPQIAAGRLRASDVKFDYRRKLGRMGINCIKSVSAGIDHEKNLVRIENGDVFSYDYLIVCTGGKPSLTVESAFSLTTPEGAAALYDRLEILSKFPRTSVKISVVGGGYTGVEAASAASVCLRRLRMRPDATIYEAGRRIINGMPDHVRNRITDALGRSSIEIVAGKQIDLSSGELICDGVNVKPDLLIISAGVRGTAGDVMSIGIDPVSGRLMVDENLRIKCGDGVCVSNIFGAGDTALIAGKNGIPVRAGAYLSAKQGVTAAGNIIRLIKGKSMVSYDGFDPGYIVPVFTAKTGSGVLYGRRIGGYPAYLLHNLISIASMPGILSKIKLLKLIIWG